LDAHHLDLFSEIASVDSITVSQEIFRCAVERKGFDDLLRGPLCGRMIYRPPNANLSLSAPCKQK